MASRLTDRQRSDAQLVSSRKTEGDRRQRGREAEKVHSSEANVTNKKRQRKKVK